MKWILFLGLTLLITSCNEEKHPEFVNEFISADGEQLPVVFSGNFELNEIQYSTGKFYYQLHGDYAVEETACSISIGSSQSPFSDEFEVDVLVIQENGVSQEPEEVILTNEFGILKITVRNSVGTLRLIGSISEEH